MTVQMVPMAGDFLLTDITGFFGRRIRGAQYLAGYPSPFQHAAGVVDDYGGTIEAMPGGARRNHVSNYRPETTRYYRLLGLRPQQRFELAAEWESMEGTPYSYLQYAYIGIVNFLGEDRVPERLEKRLDDQREVICSQLIDVGAQRRGIKLFTDGRKSGQVMPASLANDLAVPVAVFSYGRKVVA